MSPSLPPRLRAPSRLLAAVLTQCRGASAVEFVLVAPALLLFLFGIIETGRVLWFQNALNYAVQEAARCASVNPTICGTTAAVQGFAATRSSVSFPPAIFTPTTQTCGNQVSASYPASLTIPFIPRSLTLSATSCFPI